MKKHILSFVALIFEACVFAATPAVPKWLSDGVDSVYSRDKYIAFIGEGKTSEAAKNNATSAIAGYLNTSIKRETESSSEMSNNGKITAIDNRISNRIKIKSEVNNLFGIEYSESYRDKKRKTYYCVAFIDRAKAWEQIQPTINLALKTFLDFYEKALAEEEFINKLDLLYKADDRAWDLLLRLDYGRLFAPSQEAEYQQQRDKAASVPLLIDSAKKGCIVYLDVTGDYNKLITAAVQDALIESGFKVVKSKDKANYTANVIIENNETGSDPLAIIPELDMSLDYKDGTTILSYSANCEKKFVAYSLETAQRKAFPDFSVIVNEELTVKLLGLMYK